MILLNKQQIHPTIFPDKTSQVWNIEIPNINSFTVRWEFESEEEFIFLAQLKDLLDQEKGSVTLELPYLPYGRQDKNINNNSTFALHTFSKLLNVLNFDSVWIGDPHSEIALKLINNSKAILFYEEVQKAFDYVKADLVCYPDAGALSKYSNVYSFEFAAGSKVRDQLTGAITHYELTGDVNEKIVLIVDDICDGGATFKFLAKHLFEAGAKQVHLFVSHGIFSQGTKSLRESGITCIFTKEGMVYE